MAADEGNREVKRARAGPRVWARVTRGLARRLPRAGTAAKCAVDRPWRRTLRGLTGTGRRPNRRRVREKALKACKDEVRHRTFRTRGESLVRVVGDLRRPIYEGPEPSRATASLGEIKFLPAQYLH